jgi:hypothetical protein
MKKQPPYHKAYVLWLIREGTATTWNDLCRHFNIAPAERITQHAMLIDSLEGLQKAHLIDAPDGYIDSLHSPAVDGSIRISVSTLVAHIQNALKLSFTELAESDLAQRVLVTPLLSQTFSSRYKSDILVLMPFASEIKPVYEDHMKAVAAKLGMSISRADDFFTSERIMDEIWTAMLNATILIADCTHRNPNVFYEIGLAHAIGKPTILMTQDADDVPFDLRHRRYIEYAYTPRGMKEFEVALEQTIRTITTEDTEK